MKLLLPFILLVTITLSAQTEKSAPPVIVFKVPLGETVVKNEISFKMETILEDSRCPSDVTCVWEGRSKVKVIISRNGNSEEEAIVLFERGKQPLLLETETATYRAIKLMPYPTSSTKNSMKYVLLVAEEGKVEN